MGAKWLRHSGRVLGFAISGVVMLAGTALALVPLPAPGSAATISTQVAASKSIQVLPTNLLPGLLQVPADEAPSYFAGTAKGCTGLTTCVFGDKLATRRIILFGDSHALMWLPAINPFAKSHHYKLVVIWKPSCPAAWVSVWSFTNNAIDQACNTFRSTSLQTIGGSKASLVLLADRTSEIHGVNKLLIPDATWQAGEQRTITTLTAKGLKVAVIGDTTALTQPEPSCLELNMNHVQKCSVADPNPASHQHMAQELAAATATNVHYVNVHPWLCTTVCSPVIANFAVYFDAFHVTATYSAYLSGVMGSAVNFVLTH